MNTPKESAPSLLYEIRQSAVVLGMKMILLEIIVSLLHFLFSWTLGYFEVKQVNILGDIHLYSVVIFVLQVMNLIMMVFVVLHWSSRRYVLKSEELHVLKGVFRRKTVVYDLKAIQSVASVQPFFGRIFGYGNVEL